MGAPEKDALRHELLTRWADLVTDGGPAGLPLFPSMGRAAQRLRGAAEYRSARSVLVMPDPALLQARVNLLMDKGRMIAATPGLKKGLVRIEAAQVPVPRRSRDLRGGALEKAGKVLRFPRARLGRIDLMLVTGLAADQRGVLLGDGRGLNDLVWAVLVKLKSVSKATKVAALLDDEQLMDEVPADPWDLAADVIITSEKIVRPPRPSRPLPADPAGLPERLAGLPLVQAVWATGNGDDDFFEDD